jgi:hypothetical protein
MIELSSTWGHTAMKFKSCQIQTPLKELQVGSNQGRSSILAVLVSRPVARTLPVWKELRQYLPHATTSRVGTPGNTSLLPVLHQSQDPLCSCHIAVEK